MKIDKTKVVVMFITILKCIISRTLRSTIVLRSNLISFYIQPAFSAEDCISTTYLI